jgi:hypothetical protein
LRKQAQAHPILLTETVAFTLIAALRRYCRAVAKVATGEAGTERALARFSTGARASFKANASAARNSP